MKTSCYAWILPALVCTGFAAAADAEKQVQPMELLELPALHVPPTAKVGASNGKPSSAWYTPDGKPGTENESTPGTSITREPAADSTDQSVTPAATRPVSAAPADSDHERSSIPADPAADPFTQAPPVFRGDAKQRGAGTPFGLVGGVGFYYVQPLFSSNPAVVTNRTAFNAAGTASTTATVSPEFNWDFEMAPRFWLGYAFGDGWTLRAQYWRFDNSPDGVTVVHPMDIVTEATTVATVGALPIVATPLTVPGTPADTITATSSLHLDVLDFEAARSMDLGCSWAVGASLGVRYADLTQHYDATLFNPGSTDLGIAAVTRVQGETNAFHGAGPTMAGEVTYRLGGGIILYGDTRGALLYGRGRQDATQSFAGGFPPVQAFSGGGARDLLLPVGELELGVGWTHDLGRSQWFVKGGFATQMWWNAGSASAPPGGVFPSIPSIGVAAAAPVVQATSSDLAFAGFTLTAGVRY